MMHREGSCKRCGHCCLLLMPECAKKNLKRESDGTFTCSIYSKRPFNPCKTFPAPDNIEVAKAIDCGYNWVEDDDYTHGNCVIDGIPFRGKLKLRVDNNGNL